MALIRPGRLPRAVLLLVVLAAAALGLPALTPAAGAADPLLSQGRPTTASSTENAGTPASAGTQGRFTDDHPFFLILDDAVGGEWPGAPDGTTVLPQRMLVDYVRVYQ